MKRWLRALYGVAALTVAAASAQAADDWLNLATVSMTNATTPKLTNRAICYSDGRDIACDNSNLYISTGGLISVGSLQTSSYVSAGTIHTSGTVKVSNTLYADAINVPGGLTAGAVEWANVLNKPVSLTDLIGLAPDDSYIVVGNGTTWVRETGNTARTSLGLGTGDTATFANLSSGGYLNGATLQTSSYVSAGSVHTSGTVKVSNTLYADAINVPGGIAAGAVPWSGVTGKPVAIVSLSAISASSANSFIMGDGTSWTVVNATQGRTGLGLGTMATQNANAVAITGGNATGLTSISATYLYGDQVSGTSGYFPVATINSLGAGTIAASGYVSAGSIHTSGTVKVSNTLYADAISIPGGITAGAVAWLDVTGKPVSLVSLSGISTSAANHFIMGDGTSWTVVNAAQGRTGLGLGTMATQNSNAVTITGGDATGLTSISATYLSGNQISGTTGYFPAATITALSAGSIGANTVSSALVSATNISATMIQVGAGGTCANGVSGSIRYGVASNTLQICTGTGWVSLVSGSGGAGASQISLLTDVQLTNLAGRDYLRYDAGTSKWVNISESTVMSTTTMVPGWPDAIVCNVTNPSWGPTTFFLAFMPLPGNGFYYYRRTNGGIDYDLVFNSDGSFNSYGGSLVATTNCNTTTTAHYAAGRAFNFIGGANRWQDVAGFTYLTANNVGVGVTVSSSAKFEVNGLVSATSGIIYGGLTTTGLLSASTVSTSLLHLTAASTATCASSISGSIRFNNTSNTVQVCTGSQWVSLVSGSAGTASVAGATTQVQYNNGGFLAADANFAYISGTGSVSTTRVSATQVSATDVQLGAGGACSAGGHAGKIKWSGAEMQYCDGSSWTSLAPSGGGGSGTLVYKRYNSSLVGGVSYNGTTPTNTYTIPVTLPGNTWAVVIRVDYAHGSSTPNTHGYWSFDAYQQGASSSTQKVVYASQHFNDYANSDSEEIIVPWVGGGNNAVTIETTYSYNSDGLNVYSVHFVGYLAGNSSNDNLGNHVATQGLNMNGFAISNTSQVSAANISATMIQVGAGSICAASVSGSIRYGAASNTLQICTGTGWVSLSSGTATASTAGATTQVQYNNNGSLGADANFTYTSATGSVSATYVSASLVQVSGSSLSCSSAVKGAMRYSNTSSTIEYCNSTAWTSLGPSATSVPAFSVNKNSTNQTVTASQWTDLTWSTEAFDTNNNFASNGFTATIAGKYFVSVIAMCSDSSAHCAVAVVRNGTQVLENTNPGAAGNTAVVAGIVDLAISDVLTAQVHNGGGTTINGNAMNTNFTGTLIASGNGLAGGGGATPGGSDTQVQFNDGGNALGGDGDYTWNKTTNKLTINGDIEYTGTTRDTSDRRLKKEVAALPATMLDKIMLMKPVSFRMKERDQGKELGFIAQDVELLFPELVSTALDAQGTKSLNYVGLIGPLVKSVQELNVRLVAKVQAMEAREGVYVRELGTLKAANDNLREDLDALRRELRELKNGVGFRRSGTR